MLFVSKLFFYVSYQNFYDDKRTQFGKHYFVFGFGEGWSAQRAGSRGAFEKASVPWSLPDVLNLFLSSLHGAMRSKDLDAFVA